jgi:DNA modification methylase
VKKVAATDAASVAVMRYGGGQVALDEAIDCVIVGDCLEVLPALPSECVDMVFLDPPYFLQLPAKRLVRWGVRSEVESPERDWDCFASFVEYDTLMGSVLEECRRLMKPTATLWVIGTYHNIYRIGALMQDIGFWILNDVTWLKTNPMPNWLNVRLTNATETLIWAVRERGARGYVYNAPAAKIYSHEDFGAKIATNVWRIPVCAGRERVKDADGKRLHPTQKPERLLERVLRVSTRSGQTVLDPMAGTGTTGVVAKRLGRHFILIERENTYAEAARWRIANTVAVQ